MTTDQLIALEDRLFSDIQGYTLSSTGRIKLQREADPAFTYGEVTPDSMQMMIDSVQPQPGEVFYDLGSGTGKAVIFAAILGDFARCTGIELVEDLWQAANTARERYEAEVKMNLGKSSQQVSFINGNMFDQDLSDGGVVFTHCTCFDDEMMARISQKLETLKPGSRVITVTKGLVSPEFELMGSVPYRLGWGEATVCFYRRK